jgi:uncharacterized tellurite resistance protein B-like protein
MLNRIKSLLGGGPANEPALEQERIQLATCVVLLEMAHADEEFHAMEETLVRDLLQRKFAISDQDVSELVEFAQARRQESLDIFQFTRLIIIMCSQDSPTRLLLPFLARTLLILVWKVMCL